MCPRQNVMHNVWTCIRIWQVMQLYTTVFYLITSPHCCRMTHNIKLLQWQSVQNSQIHIWRPSKILPQSYHITKTRTLQNWLKKITRTHIYISTSRFLKYQNSKLAVLRTGVDTGIPIISLEYQPLSVCPIFCPEYQYFVFILNLKMCMWWL